MDQQKKIFIDSAAEKCNCYHSYTVTKETLNNRKEEEEKK